MIVQLGGRTERVRITSHDDGRLAVRVGEREYLLDRAHLGRLESLLTADGDQRETSVRRLDLTHWLVGARDGTREVTVVDPLTHLAEQGVGGAGGRRRQRITSYMPGRVVSVLVEEGAEVAAGQGLLVLEAMKMQNEILAETAGTVTRIHVAAGATVEGGDPLFDLE